MSKLDVALRRLFIACFVVASVGGLVRIGWAVWVLLSEL